MTDPDVPYALEAMPDWESGRFELRFDATGGGATISGSCPCCGHPVDKALRRTGQFAFRRDASEDPGDELMHCNCRHSHAGGTLGDGCGRYWGIEIGRR